MNTIINGAPADPIRRFTITITMDGADGEALMRLVSVFHRRQLEILQTTYERAVSTGCMVATVQATDARVHTTVLTLRNIIGVTGCEVTPNADAPNREGAPHTTVRTVGRSSHGWAAAQLPMLLPTL